MDKQKIIQAGRIAKQVKEYARTIVKKDTHLLDIAEKIESKIIELGGKPAFPVNLSIDNIAAHYTPFPEDKTLAHGLLKVDFGVHIDGWVADNAFSIDLENSEENKKLIRASSDALKNAIELIKKNKSKTTTSQIGKIIEETIESQKFSPIINLSGHSMEEYDLHAGITIPNIDDKKEIELKKGIYAIEPFASTGVGKVHDGKPSGIYSLVNEKTPRSQTAREILEFIQEEYQTLPFCSRWIVKKFNSRGLIGLRQLEENGNLHNYPELVESSDAKVSQAENTILIDDKNEVIVTTD
ncbi:MAG: type II methionyl aminopeptidase [Nanoarchaeota archaeon]|nr:type II methionyl aminopeptidase [Nanoarchaeota archaeon]